MSEHELEVLRSNTEESHRTPLVRAVLQKVRCSHRWRCCMLMLLTLV